MNDALRPQILGLMRSHGIGLFEYEGPDGTLRLDAEADIQDHPALLAQSPGRFLWTHPTENARPVWPRRVDKGEVIGWLKIGPLLHPVLAAEDAILRRPHVEHGALAGYGDRLF